mmetsp:Transcript_14168/g.28571  ORF Transcript_14168/g.28571 Transcript_14168/m.28571 type:complete len:98 (-) Transcript_14168:346-639(-)
MRDDDEIGRKFFTVDNILCCCCCVIRFGLASAVIDRAFADGEVIKQLQQQVRSRVLAVMVPIDAVTRIYLIFFTYQSRYRSVSSIHLHMHYCSCYLY